MITKAGTSAVRKPMEGSFPLGWVLRWTLKPSEVFNKKMRRMTVLSKNKVINKKFLHFYYKLSNLCVLFPTFWIWALSGINQISICKLYWFPPLKDLPQQLTGTSVSPLCFIGKISFLPASFFLVDNCIKIPFILKK